MAAEENRIAVARNEIAMVRRELDEKETRLSEIKENYDILCDEADQKMKDISSVKTALVEVQTDLSDVDQYLRDHSTDNKVNDKDSLQGLMKQYTGKTNEEAMVAKIIDVLQRSGNGSLIPSDEDPRNKGKKKQASAEPFKMDKVKVSFFPSWPHKSEEEDKGTEAYFKVVRNYTFEDLLDDCCRFWNLFPPDMQLLNRADGQWNLEKLVEDQYNKTKGRGFQVKLRYMNDEEEDKMNEEANLDDMFDFGGDMDDIEVDVTQQWPPPLDPRRLFIELIWYAIFSVLYIVYIIRQRETQDVFYLNQAMQTLIVEEEFGDPATLRLQYPDVRTAEELTWFFTSVLVDTLTGETEYTNGDAKPANELGYILSSNRIVGGIQFKQHRVKAQACSTTPREEETLIDSDPVVKRRLVPLCYPSFSSDTESRDPYGTDPNIPGFEYVPNQSGEVDTGDFGTYPSGGFIYNTTLTPFTMDTYAAQVEALLGNGWLDMQTRAVIAKMVFYNANYRYNTQVKFIVEQTPAGEYLPYPAQINSFELYVFNFDPRLNSFLICIIGAYTIYYMYVERRQMKNCKRVTGKYTKYFSDPFNIIELIIICTTLAWAGMYAFLYIHPVVKDWTYFRSTYPELGNYVSLQNYLFKIYSIIIFLLVVKLFKYFPLVHDLYLLYKMLIVAGASLASFLVMLMVLQMGFVFMANMIFGTQSEDFSTVWLSFSNLFLYFLGEFDYEALVTAEQIWGLVFFVIFQVLMVLVMLNIFLAILNDAYIDVFQSEEEEARKAERMKMKKRTWKDYAKVMKKAVASRARRRRRGGNGVEAE